MHHLEPVLTEKWNILWASLSLTQGWRKEGTNANGEEEEDRSNPDEPD